MQLAAACDFVRMIDRDGAEMLEQAAQGTRILAQIAGIEQRQREDGQLQPPEQRARRQGHLVLMHQIIEHRRHEIDDRHLRGRRVRFAQTCTHVGKKPGACFAAVRQRADRMGKGNGIALGVEHRMQHWQGMQACSGCLTTQHRGAQHCGIALGARHQCLRMLDRRIRRCQRRTGRGGSNVGRRVVGISHLRQQTLGGLDDFDQGRHKMTVCRPTQYKPRGPVQAGVSEPGMHRQRHRFKRERIEPIRPDGAALGQQVIQSCQVPGWTGAAVLPNDAGEFSGVHPGRGHAGDRSADVLLRPAFPGIQAALHPLLEKPAHRLPALRAVRPQACGQGRQVRPLADIGRTLRSLFQFPGQQGQCTAGGRLQPVGDAFT